MWRWGIYRIVAERDSNVLNKSTHLVVLCAALTFNKTMAANGIQRKVIRKVTVSHH